jgi:hypothetical protein
MRHLLKRSILLSLVVLAALFSAGKSSSSSLTAARVAPDSLPREPMGVYAKANIEIVMEKDKAIKNCTSSSGCDIHQKFREFYARLLDNPGISGLTVAQHWDHIQTAPDVYDFSFLDDAFTVANDKQKPVALIITPGVVSPPWLLDEIPDCTNKEGVFLGAGVPLNCGKQAFEGFPEEIRDDGHKEIPLPWNLYHPKTNNYQPSKYQQAWEDFLRHLNDKYKDNPAFVAIAVAGPICASDEMILPTSENDTKQQPSSLSVDETWRQLILHSFSKDEERYARYQANPDQAFVDAWKQAIDTYEKIFSGITLTLSPDGGKDLPEFDFTRKEVENNILPLSPEVAPLYHQDCSRTPTPLSCESKTEVIWNFMNATCTTSLGCVNGKATRVGGLVASINDSLGNIGIAGVKLVTSWPPPQTPPLPPLLGPPLLGGAEFDFAVSGKHELQTGCPDYSKSDTNPSTCSSLTVEEAANNVMAVFFNHTPAAPYFQGTVADAEKRIYGAAPMHYLEVPYKDVEYANENQCISNPSPTLGYMTLTQLLENANRDLLGIANGTLPMCDTLSSCDTTPPVTTAMLPAPTGLNGWYRGPVVINFNASDDLSGVFSTELSRDDQQTWEPLPCGGLKLKDDGIHNVFAFSTDLAGNPKTPIPILTTVEIDSTAPVTTVTTKTIKGISLVVLFAASDNLSGVARTEYSLDNGLHWKTGTTLVLNQDGVYTVLFRSIDVAGNVEKRNSITVNVNL